MPDTTYFRNRVRSIRYAAKGAWILLKSEASIQVQFAVALVVCAAGWYYHISPMEWIVQLLAIGMVMGLEAINTAIEALSDYVQPERDSRIGQLKDISAGAVLIGAVAAGIAGLIIYLPKIFS
ncbi:MAG: diacylglycerol kinase family protein [Robiginitalea sp.]|uniref:diacylglycerol kinase family protein n=1 Tax=Robiginitalea sp. TaxID=1902411 RepID=UPI003C70F83C